MDVVPVLEIGGTHVTAALVELAGTPVVRAMHRLDVDADASAADLLDRFASAAARLDVPIGTAWSVAMPDPFDYAHGIGEFEGVGKFAALRGVDVRDGLLARIDGTPASLTFVNDADAFALGEWRDGAARGCRRTVGLTLGTGIGSGWLVDGIPVDPGVPPGGRIHRLHVDGRPLEDAVSRRAVRREYAAAGGDATADVREVSDLARRGDTRAAAVLAAAFRALGQVVAPVVAGFGADVLVVGGSMAASWDLFAPWFDEGAGTVTLPTVRVSADSARASLVGTAVAVRQLPPAIPVAAQA